MLSNLHEATIVFSQKETFKKKKKKLWHDTVSLRNTESIGVFFFSLRGLTLLRVPLTRPYQFPMTFYAWIQIYNLSGLFSPTELLNECPSHIQICPTAIMKTQGFPSGMTVCKIHCFLFPTALTMATVLQSDCNSCFLCIYANVCLDITDSGLIVFLPAFKNQIKVSSKWIVINYSTMEFFVIPQGQVVCMQITLLA